MGSSMAMVGQDKGLGVSLVCLVTFFPTCSLLRELCPVSEFISLKGRFSQLIGG